MDFGIYVHIPFCVRKCNYCDFLSFGKEQWNQTIQEDYVSALCQELKANSLFFQENKVATVYFGGGTPSILDEHLISKIMNCIRSCFTLKENVEITIECNPGTTTYDKFLMYQEAGINRLSLGLQSTNNAMLKQLGRIHTFETFLEQYEDARRAGFNNINVDLISALPKQTIKDYERDIKKLIGLAPEHISSYSLIIEEETGFSKNSEVLKNLPSEEEAVFMYEQTKHWLKQAGYERYEISNYCKKGKESRHNSSYWTGILYLGIGLGASSYLLEQGEYIRFHNETDLAQYIKQNQVIVSKLSAALKKDMGNIYSLLDGYRQEKEILTLEDRMEEFMFLGLRMMKGVSYQEFERRFCLSMDSVYGDMIEKHIKGKLLTKYQKDGEVYLTLTEEGISVSNQVFVDFML